MLPSLFISHGSPTIALEPGRTGQAWRELAAKLPRPKAIVVSSAHWEATSLEITISARPETIHDFGGFPPELYERRYPAPGEPSLATRIIGLLSQSGFSAFPNPVRGLDHGAWIPLSLMYPAADIPVVQISLPRSLSPLEHYRVGQALGTLASENILILGSGNLTHNLREVVWSIAEDTVTASYVTEFQGWVNEKLLANDVASLASYASAHSAGMRAHPTPEHFLPLFTPFGAAASGSTPQRFYSGVTFGVLGMDIYIF